MTVRIITLRRVLFLPLMLILMALPVSGRTVKEVGPLFSFACVAQQDPAVSPASAINLCSSGRASGGFSLFSGSGRLLPDLNSELYSGLHIHDHTSVHWKGILKSSYASESFKEHALTKKTDYLFFRMGNHSHQRWEASLGLIRPAFGLGTYEFESWLNRFEISDFEFSAGQGCSLSFDNLTSLNATVSVSRPWLTEAQGGRNSGISLRLINDISSWSGTRIALSLMAGENGRRLISMGAINVAPDGTTSLLDWIRVMHSSHGLRGAFLQKLLLMVRGAIRGGKQTYVRYEDVRGIHRLFTLGQKYHFNSNIHLDVAAGFKKDETQARMHQWFLSAGAGIRV